LRLFGIEYWLLMKSSSGLHFSLETRYAAGHCGPSWGLVSTTTTVWTGNKKPNACCWLESTLWRRRLCL